ncbi:tyrosine-type recombinase/integrase [Glycomyces xiaoerkulensis]|uniref:tyrosine-type recombinase/integrase n=1 Tax=Glycomyces xiaoerkulensis TaxID=2038139 RepID=UPI000C269A16|nr:tyrosine-type recombinase/integrase [Glycomyces xiaoerkulensis]
MGYSIKRKRRDGYRYTAMYKDPAGVHRSAGTFPTKKRADQEWKAAETKVAESRGSHLVRGRQTFRTYVEKSWLPNLAVEVTTRENYTYALYAHLMGFFEHKRMLDIYADDVRAWIKGLKDAGMSAHSRKYCKILLSTIMNCAVGDEVIAVNPCASVKMEKVAAKPLPIITPEQYQQFHDALPDEMSKLLVEVAIETGMRWGELTELRPKDINRSTRRLTVARAVVQVNKKFHPTGGRFHVKDYPKNGEWRAFKIGQRLCDKLDGYISENGIGSEDLIFSFDGEDSRAQQQSELAQTDLGFTEPNSKGRKYRHGTTSAYTAGKCRCQHCRRAMADYRASRRAEGKDDPRSPRTWETDGHIPRRWFREKVIKPALEEADLGVDIRMHMLRHAHASWLLNGGADLMVVKTRLGHASITTTERYLHTLDNADETALDAFDAVRFRNIPKQISGEAAQATSLVSDGEENAQQLLAQLTEIQTKLAKLVT